LHGGANVSDSSVRFDGDVIKGDAMGSVSHTLEKHSPRCLPFNKTLNLCTWVRGVRTYRTKKTIALWRLSIGRESTSRRLHPLRASTNMIVYNGVRLVSVSVLTAPGMLCTCTYYSTRSTSILTTQWKVKPLYMCSALLCRRLLLLRMDGDKIPHHTLVASRYLSLSVCV